MNHKKFQRQNLHIPNKKSALRQSPKGKINPHSKEWERSEKVPIL